ncbi:hypothetical protein ACFCT7_16510, partial [Fulvivirgaceae bacterium LMO-SS25]
KRFAVYPIHLFKELFSTTLPVVLNDHIPMIVADFSRLLVTRFPSNSSSPILSSHLPSKSGCKGKKKLSLNPNEIAKKRKKNLPPQNQLRNLHLFYPPSA